MLAKLMIFNNGFVLPNCESKICVASKRSIVTALLFLGIERGFGASVQIAACRGDGVNYRVRGEV